MMGLEEGLFCRPGTQDFVEEWSAAHPGRRVTKAWVHATVRNVAAHRDMGWVIRPEVLAQVATSTGGGALADAAAYLGLCCAACDASVGDPAALLPSLCLCNAACNTYSYSCEVWTRSGGCER
jgi:hypothetical protein